MTGLHAARGATARGRETAPPAGPAGPSAERAIGAFLRSIREAQRLSQDQVVAMTAVRPRAVSRATLSAIERGQQLPNLEALSVLSRVLHFDPMEVLERLELAARAPVDVSDLSLEDLSLRAARLAREGEYREALAACEAMADRLVLDPPKLPAERVRLQAEIELRRAALLRRCGALLAAKSSAERTIALSEGLVEIQAQGYVVLSSLHSQMGNAPLADSAAETAAALSANCGERTRSRALIQKGRVLWDRGSYEEARQRFVTARDLALRCGDVDDAVLAEGNIGMCWLELGKLHEARMWVSRAVDTARKQSLLSAEATWLAGLGRVALAEGHLDEAERHGWSALRIARPRSLFLTEFRAEWLLHQVTVQKDPADPDSKRLSHLEKLAARLGEHIGEREIREFKSLRRAS